MFLMRENAQRKSVLCLKMLKFETIYSGKSFLDGKGLLVKHVVIGVLTEM